VVFWWVIGPQLIGGAVASLFVSPVVVAERARPGAAVRRAWRLMRGNWGVGIAYVSSMAVLNTLLVGGLTLLPGLAEESGLVSFFGNVDVVSGVVANLALLLVVPFNAMTTAQLYLQVRMRREGIDLVDAAEGAFR
jgi:hypothetical protein